MCINKLYTSISLISASGIIAPLDAIGQESKDVSHEKMNIIFLLTDDQNYGSVGCYGNNEVQTPNIDKLGYKGVIFDKHYNTTAISMASRASIFTGMYEYKTGTNFDHGNMKQEVWNKSYPMLLRQNGYFTAFAGKFGFVVEGKGICDNDFDMYAGASGQTSYKSIENKYLQKYAQQYPHTTLAYGEFGRDVIKEAAKKDLPFCLSISFKAPHLPVEPDPRFDDVYKDKKFTKPKNFGREAGKHMSLQSKQGRQYTRFTTWHYDTDYDNVMAQYYQLIYGVDYAIGMILDELEKQGLAENTVVIYTSDNGYICGAHGYASKVLPMEESSRAPLIIYNPKNKRNGTRCKELTANIDIAPTILNIAGIEATPNMDGKNINQLLFGETESIHDKLAVLNTWGPVPTQYLACITKNWKYTYWWYGDEKMKPTEELFDLKNDPLEMDNVINREDCKSIANMMRMQYDELLYHIDKNAVYYNNYRQYSHLFDRNESWKNKKFNKTKKINESNHYN